MPTVCPPSVSTKITLTDRESTKQPKIGCYSDYLHTLRWGYGRQLDNLVANKSMSQRLRSPQFKAYVRMQPPSQIEICEGFERSPIFDPLV